MKFVSRYARSLGVLTPLFLPMLALAQSSLGCTSAGGDTATCALRALLLKNILNPILALILAAAVVVFIWGVFQYFSERREGKPSGDGQNHMLWGLIGLFVCSSAIAFITIIQNTISAIFPK